MSAPGSEPERVLMADGTESMPDASGSKADAGDAKAVAEAEELEDNERIARTAFVGNVPSQTTRKELKRLFKAHGKVENVRMRGIIAANPKMPKKTAFLARRMHTGVDTVLAYVVFKKEQEGGKVGSEGKGESEDKGNFGYRGFKTKDGEERDVECKPSAEVFSACDALNFTMLHGKHIRVSPAMHTRAPVRKSILVGNLPFDVTEEELILVFKDAVTESGAKLVNVRVTRDKETGMGRGVGFVSFSDELGVREAMNKELKIRGRTLRMEKAMKAKKQNAKTTKRRVKKEENKLAHYERTGGVWSDEKRRQHREAKHRDAKTGEVVTRKGRKELSAKKTIVKVKHAARKARQAAAASGEGLAGTGRN